MNMKAQKKPKSEEAAKPLKLNIGCGTCRTNDRGELLEGYTHIDMSKDCNPDMVLDVTRLPWPFEDESVSEVYCSHFLEHLDGIERIAFFNELYRVMKSGATIKVITPAPFTHRYMQDPTHKFPMVVQEFYNYLHRESRKAMGVDHYPIHCNFEWGGLFIDNPELMNGRNDEFRNFHARHSINALMDLVVTLTRK